MTIVTASFCLQKEEAARKSVPVEELEEKALVSLAKGLYLVVGNVGDYRAVLGTRDKDDSLFLVQLVVNLKPNLPEWNQLFSLTQQYSDLKLFYSGSLRFIVRSLSRKPELFMDLSTVFAGFIVIYVIVWHFLSTFGQ